MSIYGPVNVSHQPNWPSSHGQPLTNGGNPQLAKKILENNSTSNASIDIKKVSKMDSQKKTDNPDTYFSSRLPYFPPNSKPLQNIIEKVTSSRKHYLAEIEKTPQDMAPRTQFTIHTLALARICHQTKQLEDEGKLISSVQSAVDSFLLCKYFQAGTHLSKYLLDGYHGITCLDMNVIRDNLLILKRAIALSSNNDTEHQKLIAELDQAAKFFEARWKELKDEGQISEENFKILSQQLKQTLTEDPFREEFIKNPELFKKVKDAPAILLQKYPHLASVDSFLSRYPEAGIIELSNNTYDSDSLELCITQAKSNPLARLILLVAPKSMITLAEARALKDLLIAKPHIGIVVGNLDDEESLRMAFEKDSSLKVEPDNLISRRNSLDTHGEVITFFINPQNPVRRKQ